MMIRVNSKVSVEKLRLALAEAGLALKHLEYDVYSMIPAEDVRICSEPNCLKIATFTITRNGIPASYCSDHVWAAMDSMKLEMELRAGM